MVLSREQAAAGSMFLQHLTGDLLGKIVACAESCQKPAIAVVIAAVQAVALLIGISSCTFKSEGCNAIDKSHSCAVCLLL